MRSHRIALAIAALALMLGAAACQRPDADADTGIATAGGAAPSSRSAGSAAPTGASQGVDEAKWVKCLRDQGLEVTYPDPGQGDKPQLDEQSVPAAQLHTALQTCQRFNPNYGRPAPPMDPALLERWRQFARCMRAEGVDMPDPEPGAVRPPVVDLPRGSGVPGDNAFEVCSKEVPGLVTVSNDGPKGGQK